MEKLVCVTVLISIWCFINIRCCAGFSFPCEVSKDPLFPDEGLCIDCRNRNLTTVPKNLTFFNVTTLLLGENLILRVERDDFENFRDLRRLDLKSNGLREISDDAFRDISQLVFLDLKFNDLQGGWPGQALSALHNLKELHLDSGITGRLGPLPVGFKQLININKISLAGLHLANINSTFFANLNARGITDLNMAECIVSSVESGAFTNFRKILTLTLNAVGGMTYNGLRHIIGDLNGSNLTHLNLSGVESFNALDDSLFSSFTNNTLKTLILSYSSVLTIADAAFANLATLDTLRLDNTNIKKITAGMFTGLKNLRHLDVSSTHIDGYEFRSSGLDGLQVLNMSYSGYLFKMESHRFVGLTNLKELYMDSCVVEILDECALCGMPYLERLEMPDMHIERLNPNAFSGLNSLVRLDLTSSGLGYLNQSLFSEMASLEILVLNDNVFNDPYTIEATAFQKLTRIKQIFMEKCAMASDYGLFRGLITLESIHLSHNSGMKLTHNAFDKTLKLTKVNLSYVSTMKSLPRAVKYTYLDYLDITHNGLGVFTNSDLGYLKSSRIKRIAAAGNSFICSCGQRKFLQWFNTTQKIMDDRSTYYCGDVPITNFDWSKCETWMKFVISISSASVVLVGAIALSLFRFRWALRYRWYKFRVYHYRKLEREREDELNESLIFDAFVSYSSKDYEFVLNCLMPNLERPPPGEDTFHLAIDFREFIPGKTIADNIITHIDRSRKTIILLSNNFINSDWTLFEFEMAHSKLAQRQDVIIPVVLESIHHRSQELPKALAKLIKSHLCIEWTSDPRGQDSFWRRLRAALKHPVIRANFGNEP